MANPAAPDYAYQYNSSNEIEFLPVKVGVREEAIRLRDIWNALDGGTEKYNAQNKYYRYMAATFPIEARDAHMIEYLNSIDGIARDLEIGNADLAARQQQADEIAAARSPAQSCSTCSPSVGSGFDPAPSNNAYGPSTGTVSIVNTVATLPLATSVTEGTVLTMGGSRYRSEYGQWTLLVEGSSGPSTDLPSSAGFQPVNAPTAVLMRAPGDTTLTIGWKVPAVLGALFLVALWAGLIEL